MAGYAHTNHGRGGDEGGYLPRASAHPALVALSYAVGTLGRLDTASGWLTSWLTCWLYVYAHTQPAPRRGRIPRGTIVDLIKRDGAAHPCSRVLRPHSYTLPALACRARARTGGGKRDVC